MPADWNPGTQWAQAFAIGSNAATDAFNTGLRMQQLRSEQAMRRLQEQQLAQQLSFQMEAHNNAIQERADMAKAMARVQLQSQPVIPVPADGPPTADGQPPTAFLPNPDHVPLDQSLLQNVLPVLGKYRPGEVDSFVSNVAMLPYRMAQAEQLSGGGANPAGSVQQVANPGGPPLNVYVPPHGRGANQIVGGGDLRTETDPETGDRFYFDRRGERVRIPRDPEGRMLRVDDIKKLKDAPGGAALLEWDEGKGAFVLPSKNAEEARRVLSAAGNITTGTRTKLETQQTEVAKVFALGQQLAPLITPENVGARGNVTRLFEGIASQIVPGYKIGTATDAATVAKEFQAGLVRGLKSDGNIAEPERKTLESAMPSVTAWTKGAPQAKATLATTLKQWGTLSRNNAQILGKPIFPQWLTRDEIRAQLAAGEINGEQANALMESNGWELINKLREEALR